MEGETGTGTTYGRNVKFIRIFFWESKTKR